MNHCLLSRTSTWPTTKNRFQQFIRVPCSYSSPGGELSGRADGNHGATDTQHHRRHRRHHQYAVRRTTPVVQLVVCGRPYEPSSGYCCGPGLSTQYAPHTQATWYSSRNGPCNPAFAMPPYSYIFGRRGRTGRGRRGRQGGGGALAGHQAGREHASLPSYWPPPPPPWHPCDQAGTGEQWVAGARDQEKGGGRNSEHQ